MPLLQATDLSIAFPGTLKPLWAVSRVSFSIDPRERMALVGESGSGKTLTGMSCLGLIPNNAEIQGSVLLDGVELVGASENELRKVRGAKVGVVFQDPATSLNPVRTVGDQISEMYRRHLGAKAGEARSRAIELMKSVRIPAPEHRYNDYPHQLSGGLKQRAMIAIALTLSPSLLVLDEPTTALDVTVEAQILDLLLELSETRQMALLLISHDLGVVSTVCQRVLTMYAGQIVEDGAVREVYERPAHPYTAALLDSLIEIDEPPRRHEPISGQPPTLADEATGCRFAPRCPYTVARCAEPVSLLSVADGRESRCIFAAKALRGEGWAT